MSCLAFFKAERSFSNFQVASFLSLSNSYCDILRLNLSSLSSDIVLSNSSLIRFFLYSKYVIQGKISSDSIQWQLVWIFPFQVLGFLSVKAYAFSSPFSFYEHSLPLFYGEGENTKTSLSIFLRVSQSQIFGSSIFIVFNIVPSLLSLLLQSQTTSLVLDASSYIKGNWNLFLVF